MKNSIQKLLFIFGTRPEAIKMAPLILKAKNDSLFVVSVCVTGQHNEMLHQVLDFFKITPDYNINIMTHDQSLFDITADILKELEIVLVKENPNLVLVQGDTTTAFIGALGAFYMKIPVAHIEAGLRSNNKFSPFPETPPAADPLPHPSSASRRTSRFPFPGSDKRPRPASWRSVAPRDRSPTQEDSAASLPRSDAAPSSGAGVSLCR